MPPLSPVERVHAAYRRDAEVDRPEIWITRRPEAEAVADAEAVEARLRTGDVLPLAGLVLAVKDNVDVAGLRTTAGHPAFGTEPAARTATAVQRLLDAGAVLMGKTNLDQFATGLTGSRSPYGAVRSALDPERVSGGSSAGSGAAVGLGVVDLAVATDTAGSGRVPAAFNGVVGIKPTLGLVPKDGVVPACASWDCVTVLAPTLELARRALAVMIGPCELDPTSRTWPDETPLAAPATARVAVPRDEDLTALGTQERALFDAACQRLVQGGTELGRVDLTPFLDGARLLYDGALVAERAAAYGAFLQAHPDGADPSVAAIAARAATVGGPQLADDTRRLRELSHQALRSLDGFDALLVPTAPVHPTLAEVAADPIGVNARLGTYTNFVNLFDLAAVAVPAGRTTAGGGFGVTVVTRAFADQVALDLAALLAPGVEHAVPARRPPLPPVGVPLVVFGAHLRGEPRNVQLVRLGARFVGEVRTAPGHRMHVAADGQRPVVTRDVEGGTCLPGEEWLLSPSALGRLLATVTAPLALGQVELSDGRWVHAFTGTLTGAEADITPHGGWRAYRRSSGHRPADRPPRP